MGTFTAGQQLTAASLNSNPVEATEDSGLVAATGFSVNSFSGRQVGKFVTVVVNLERTGSTIAQFTTHTGNIPDTSLCTLPSGWRPPETINAIFGNGFVDGECVISTSGVISLRSVSGADGVRNGGNVQVSARWITS